MDEKRKGEQVQLNPLTLRRAELKPLNIMVGATGIEPVTLPCEGSTRPYGITCGNHGDEYGGPLTLQFRLPIGVLGRGHRPRKSVDYRLSQFT